MTDKLSPRSLYIQYNDDHVCLWLSLAWLRNLVRLNDDVVKWHNRTRRYYLPKQLVVCLDRASVLTPPHGAISSLALIFLRLAPDSRLQQMHCGKEVQCLPERCYCWADGERGQLIKIIERHHNGSLSQSLRMLFALLPTHAHGWWAIDSNSFTNSQVQWQFICGWLPKIHLPRLLQVQCPFDLHWKGTPNWIL